MEDLAANDKITQLTDGMYDYASLALAGDKVIALRHSMSMVMKLPLYLPPATVMLLLKQSN